MIIKGINCFFIVCQLIPYAYTAGANHLHLLPALPLISKIQAIREEKGFSRPDIAKYAISALVGRPVAKLKVDQLGQLYIVSYLTSGNIKSLSFKVRFEGAEILWGDASGKWRNKRSDKKMNYWINGEQLIVNILYSNGYAEGKMFKK